jgi:hypothetical protein
VSTYLNLKCFHSCSFKKCTYLLTKIIIPIFSVIFSQCLGGLQPRSPYGRKAPDSGWKKQSSLETVEMWIVKYLRRNFNGLCSRHKLVYVLCLSLIWAIGLVWFRVLTDIWFLGHPWTETNTSNRAEFEPSILMLQGFKALQRRPYDQCLTEIRSENVKYCHTKLQISVRKYIVCTHFLRYFVLQKLPLSTPRRHTGEVRH